MKPNQALDSIALSHGQTRWLLSDVLDLSEGSDSTFDSYLKFLRRNGVPFAPNEAPYGPGFNVVYRYHHIMEVVLALTLRRQAILKSDVIGLLVSMRDELRPLLRQAWLERQSGRGSMVSVEIDGSKVPHGSGLWLDLRLSYNDIGVLSTKGPKLLGPKNAVKLFFTLNHQAYFRDPIKISDLAAKVVEAAPKAPEIRRGPS